MPPTWHDRLPTSIKGEGVDCQCHWFTMLSCLLPDYESGAKCSLHAWFRWIFIAWWHHRWHSHVAGFGYCARESRDCATTTSMTATLPHCYHIITTCMHVTLLWLSLVIWHAFSTCMTCTS